MKSTKHNRFYNLLKAPMALDLQLFAEGDELGADSPGGEQKPEGTGTPPEFVPPKTQSEFDSSVGKAVNTALANAKKEWEKQETQKLEQVKTQAEKLAQMSAEDKAAELESQRIKTIEEREAQLMRRELKVTAIDILSEKGMPAELADVLNYTDENTTKGHLDALETAFNKAVEATVDKRLLDSAYVPAGGASTKGMTRSEQLAKEANAQEKPKTSHWG